MNCLLSFKSYFSLFKSSLQKELKLKKIGECYFCYFQIILNKQLIALINITLSTVGTPSGSEPWLKKFCSRLCVLQVVVQ